MTYVLSLIAAKSKAALTEDHVTRAAAEIQRAGGQAIAPTWLGEGEAAEICFEGERDPVLEQARALFSELPVDVNMLPTSHRRKKLLVADMDSTMIQQECIDELAAELGLGEKVSAITERAMRGEIAFEPALRERVALLAGLAGDTVERILAERIVLMPGGATLIKTVRANGAYTALVSGGFTAFAGPISRKIGFDEFRANELLFEGAAFSGLVAEPILGRDAKKTTLLELTERFALEPEETIAVGDGANDLAMVEGAGLGIAYHAKAALKAAASAILDHADLTGILYLQGYRRNEFVDA